MLAAFFGAEACCKHVVDTAKSEVESNPNASRAMREFASIRLEDAEVGVRRVLIKCCLTTPIPISWIDLGEEPHQKKLSMGQTVKLGPASLRHWPFATCAGWRE